MKNYLFLLLAATMLFCSGCSINNNIMFKTDKDYQFNEPPTVPKSDYKISPNDFVQFRLFTNDGYKLIDMTASIDLEDQQISQTLNNLNQVQYLVEIDGMVKLPILGKIQIVGLTVAEAQTKLEQLYSTHYKKPYVLMQIVNRRVTVYPGNGGDARVITLTNNNTTVIEALAFAGGITTRGRAARVKVIRENGDSRDVYLIDLSTIEGVKYGDMVVQANDIIYVEPVPEIGNELVKDIAPIITIISSSLVIYSVVNTLNN